MYRIVLVNNEIKVGQMIVSFLLVNQSNLDLNLSKHSFLPLPVKKGMTRGITTRLS